MKRLSFLITVMLLGAVSLWARPGYTKPIDVKQPDGTTVTLLMHGDEYLSYMTTIDGYTVVKGADGFYRYAEKQGGTLKATTFIAKNSAERTTQEQAFLANKQKNIHADMTETAKESKARAAQMYAPMYADGNRRITTIWPRINYDSFKGLVILVNWNDKQFTMNNPQEFYQKLTSEKNYQDASLANYPVPVTGSARDYFFDNSMGMFDPTFDVVGPVNINYSCTYPHPKNNDGTDDNGFNGRFYKIVKAVLDGVNNNVNFADYDMNNDGYIDIVYFIFAGYGSYVQGNSGAYLWPHANNLTGVSSWYTGIPNYDGKKFGRYACSVEIQDYEAAADQHVWLDGIGTICHEFSHVLGLADHYDTDYEGSGGQSNHPDGYDIMAGGADYNNGLTPVGYNALERHMLGFGEPTILTEAGIYSLEAFNTGNQSYIITSAKANEDFYIENRQNQGWDKYLPGHGLLVWRADTSNPSIWKSNSVNDDPNKMCFEVVTATGTTMGANATFPGTGNQIDLTAETNTLWGSKKAAMDLYDITETDGVISFAAGKDIYPIFVEDFENTPLTDANTSGLAGKFCTWSLVNSKIVSVSNYGNGSHVAQIGRSGYLASSKLERGLHALKFTVQNGNGAKIKFIPQISTDGNTWTNLSAPKEIAKNKSVSYSFYRIAANSYIRFAVQSTSASADCYIDDIQVSLDKGANGIDEMISNKQSRNSHILYNLSGQRVSDGFKGIVIKNGKKMMNK